MNRVVKEVVSVMSLKHLVSRLGTKMIVACCTAIIAAVLLLASPEIGIASAVGGIVMAGISAVLVHPTQIEHIETTQTSIVVNEEPIHIRQRSV